MLNSLKILGKTVLVESVEFIKKLFYPRQSGMETGEFLLAYGGALGVAFYKFILEARDSFGRLVKHIGVIIDDMIKISKSALKDTAEKMLIYSKRIIAAVTGFFNNLASGINNFLIYRKKAGFNLLHSTVEIVIEGINNAKEIIKKGREKLKEGANKVVNYLNNIAKAVTVNLAKKAAVECIRGLKLLIDKIKESVLGIKGLEVSLTAVFLKFMSEAEKALVRLKDYVLGIANNIKDAVHTGIKAMEDFKDRIEKAISNFILSISNGIKNFAKYCKKEVANMHGIK
jgi:phage-related protein